MKDTQRRTGHRQTHCKYGHERTPENVNAKGACRTCKRAANKLIADAQREARHRRAEQERRMEAARIDYYRAGLISYLYRRRHERHIPVEGRRAA